MPDIDRSKIVASNTPDLEATTEAGLGTQNNHVRIAANEDTASAALRFGSYEVSRELGSGAFGSTTVQRVYQYGDLMRQRGVPELNLEMPCPLTTWRPWELFSAFFHSCFSDESGSNSKAHLAQLRFDH